MHIRQGTHRRRGYNNYRYNNYVIRHPQKTPRRKGQKNLMKVDKLSHVFTALFLYYCRDNTSIFHAISLWSFSFSPNSIPQREGVGTYLSPRDQVRREIPSEGQATSTSGCPYAEMTMTVQTNNFAELN